MQFLIELGQRFLSKTPKFFKIVRLLGIIAGIVTGIPALLESNGVILPDALLPISSKLVSICGWVVAFVAQLTTTDSGILNKSSDSGGGPGGSSNPPPGGRPEKP